MAGYQYDHDQVARQVLGHLVAYPGGLSEYEIARALGYTKDREHHNNRKVRTALLELEKDGYVESHTEPFPTTRGYRRVWVALPTAGMVL